MLIDNDRFPSPDRSRHLSFLGYGQRTDPHLGNIREKMEDHIQKIKYLHFNCHNNQHKIEILQRTSQNDVTGHDLNRLAVPPPDRWNAGLTMQSGLFPYILMRAYYCLHFPSCAVIQARTRFTCRGLIYQARPVPMSRIWGKRARPGPTCSNQHAMFIGCCVLV